MGLSSSTLAILQDNVFPYARIDMWNNKLLHFLSEFVTSTLNDDLYAVAG